MVFNREGMMFVTATLSRDNASDVVFLEPTDGDESFSMERLGRDLPRERKWWPNLERPTGHNLIDGRPGLLFGAGVRGQTNTDILANDVYWLG